MRTLVVSDLHLGARTGHDVLREPIPRAKLLAALADVDRLVLLGDVLELRHGPVGDALGAAAPVLAEIGAALGADAEVVIVPGNHDHHLATPWLERRARRSPSPLGLEAPIDWRSGETLATVARRLAPARVRASYPGLWLREDVYALHGHYGDRHTTVPMLERLGAGAMARIVRTPSGGPRRAEDYESVLAPLYSWLYALAQSGGPELGPSPEGPSSRARRALQGSPGRGRQVRRRALAAGFPVLIAAINRAGLGPVRANLSGSELRRAALRATGEVLARLDVVAPHVVFGHTHRAGPLAGDRAAEWSAPTGARLVNTGSWVNEPQFIGERPEVSPYRPGFAVRLEDHGPPELRCLLDDRRV